MSIHEVREVLQQLDLVEKADSDDEKLRLLRACRGRLSDELLVWLDAVYVLLDEGRAFPPLLGTGGNEGSGSYMSGFAQQVVAVIENRQWDHALAPCLFGDVSSHVGNNQTPRHFYPVAAGGPNASSGFEGSVDTNPWDYLLSLEGTLLFAASASKRLESRADGSMAFPFCVRSAGVGYPSADLRDEALTRAEMWFPIWPSPATTTELEALINEGRAVVNQRRVCTAVDFARAVSTLGIDRGVSQFVRFGFQQRNGQSNFAIPLGTYYVSKQQNRAVTLLNPIDGWLDRFRRMANSGAGRAGRALRRVETAILNVCQQGTASSVQSLLIALGEAEASVAASPKLRKGDKRPGLSPVPLLPQQWIVEANDGSPEFRLAAALASITHESVGPMRRHLEPIDIKKLPTLERRSGRAVWADNDNDPALVWGGGNLVRNLNAVLARRIVEVFKAGKESQASELLAPLRGRCPASMGDIAAFIGGDVDDARIEALLRGLMLVDWSRVAHETISELRGPSSPVPAALYSLLKLCHLPQSLTPPGTTSTTSLRLDPQISRRAIAGDASGATALAARRLLASGLPPAVKGIDCRREHLLRTTAALMFPLSKASATRLAKTILDKAKRPEADEAEKAAAGAT